ncbi:TetR/AcrR family transcriptional regulator [Iamia sp. SCSIO 61187]|uniref:TetR/AcrR family transcriptional regulator n=1 Tax=Iamia sp. SCSIO 61187 TaxID=2722752 RepID=UPI001C627239|nr:TetR/AcrR family transcriptional regulator [Iamia sp. SCSIO 61187]QYG94420.1 TetR/AcrR family transcriptional regulator [Iamia sp. SCSIO 61187]
MTDLIEAWASRVGVARACRAFGVSCSPRGEHEVKEAVLEAASVLFAEKGPAATSLREIARAAAVNHGLIHRHFGSKQRLVGAVHDHLAQRLAATDPFRQATVASALDAFHTLEDNRTYWMVLTRAMLDGELADVLGSDLAGGHRMVETLRAAIGDHADLDASDLMAFAFSFGWLLLRDFIQAATGAGDDVPEQWFAAMASLLDLDGRPRR